METRFLRKSNILQAVHSLMPKGKVEVFLVGGAVRDLFLRKGIGKDLDFVTTGEVKTLAEQLARKIGGTAFPLDESFGTWRVVLKGAKKKTDADFSPMQGKNILEDLRRRDFSINSMAVDINEVFTREAPALIDPLGGLADLQRKILRTNGEQNLREDPLRMLRAFRFAHLLDLQMEDETLEMIRRNQERIKLAAAERIRSEFFAGLNASGADRFLRDLQQAGLLGQIFPEVAAWPGVEQGGHHDFPLLEHAFRTVAATEWILAHLPQIFPAYAPSLQVHFGRTIEEGIGRKAFLKFVALFHDSGKPSTRTVNAQDQSVRFLDHDSVGRGINEQIARRLKLSRRAVRILGELTRHHMRSLSLSKGKEITPRAGYRFFGDLGIEGLDAALLAQADALATRETRLQWPLVLPDDVNRVMEASSWLVRYYYEEFTSGSQKPLLDGREIMEALQVPEGEKVGVLLGRLREAEMAGRVRTREVALAFLRNCRRE